MEKTHHCSDDPNEIKKYAIRVMKMLTKKKTRPMLMCFHRWCAENVDQESDILAFNKIHEDRQDAKTVLVFNDKYITVLLPFMMKYCHYRKALMSELAALKDLNAMVDGHLVVGPVYTPDELRSIESVFKLYARSAKHSASPLKKSAPVEPVTEPVAKAVAPPPAPKPVVLPPIPQPVVLPPVASATAPPPAPAPALPPQSDDVETICVPDYEESCTLQPEPEPETKREPPAAHPVVAPPAPPAPKPPMRAVDPSDMVIPKDVFDDLANKIWGLQLSVKIMQNM